MEARPKSLLSDFVAAGNLQFVEALKEFHDGLQAPVADVAASEDEAVNAGGTMWEILDGKHVAHIQLVGSHCKETADIVNKLL